jgi:hypothetical protein
MALKPRLANTPQLDSEGYATGSIKSVSLLDSSSSDYDKEQFVFIFEIAGKLKSIQTRVWTGITVGCEKSDYSDPKHPKYPKLTRLLLATGLLQEDSLASLTSEDLKSIDIESLAGKSIRCKMVSSVKNKGLSVPDIDTIELV